MRPVGVVAKLGAVRLWRIELLGDGRVRVGMKRVWSDGTSGIELSPLEVVEKLAAAHPRWASPCDRRA